MKKWWLAIAAFFAGAFLAMLTAFKMKKTTVVNINKEENIDIVKPKVKGDNSAIDNIVTTTRKTITEKKVSPNTKREMKHKLKIIRFKNKKGIKS
jgi:hypothetical protein